MTFHETFGNVPRSTLRTIKLCNVSPADWDAMLVRWGFAWGDESLPFADIENFIRVHSQSGSYNYPMYG